jgi:hypothetical protein
MLRSTNYGRLEPATGRLENRVAAMFVALLAQPLSKIASFWRSDVVINGGATGLGESRANSLLEMIDRAEPSIELEGSPGGVGPGVT